MGGHKCKCIVLWIIVAWRLHGGCVGRYGRVNVATLNNSPQLIWSFFTNSNVAHYKVKCNANSFISCASSFPNRTLMGLPAQYVAKPQFFYELPAHEGVRCIFVNPWDTSTIHLSLNAQKTWPWLKPSQASLPYELLLLHVYWRPFSSPSPSSFFSSGILGLQSFGLHLLGLSITLGLLVSLTVKTMLT
jgi:hypothetical protein